jgi:hypothetical protein
VGVWVGGWVGVGVSELPKLSLKRGGRKLENLKVVLGQVFKYKLGCFDDVHVLIYGGCTHTSTVENWAQVLSF